MPRPAPRRRRRWEMIPTCWLPAPRSRPGDASRRRHRDCRGRPTRLLPDPSVRSQASAAANSAGRPRLTRSPVTTMWSGACAATSATSRSSASRSADGAATQLPIGEREQALWCELAGARPRQRRQVDVGKMGDRQRHRACKSPRDLPFGTIAGNYPAADRSTAATRGCQRRLPWHPALLMDPACPCAYSINRFDCGGECGEH